MIKNYTIIFFAGLLVLLTLNAYIIYKMNDSGGKTAFVKNSDLYNDFALKKELEAKLTTIKNQRKTILDSLLLHLKLASSELENSKGKDEMAIKKFQFKKQEYLVKEKEFQEDNDRLADQYSQQIWKQINQYVSDFGKQKGYTYIYGATGDGALMYAQDKNDITEELKQYMSSKYKGDKN